MCKFKVGTRVMIKKGRGEGHAGIIKEKHDTGTDYEEYHVRLDGEKQDRIYYEYNMILEEDTAKEMAYLTEMGAKIPTERNKPNLQEEHLMVVVGKNEHTDPHFHVYREKPDLQAWINGACLTFNEPKYFMHQENNAILNKSEMVNLVEYLKARCAVPDRNISNWEYLIEFWNTNNPNYKIDEHTPMPDYLSIYIDEETETTEVDGDYGYLGEMATVATSRDPELRIQVNPDPHRKGVPYFKVFNTSKLKAGESKVCRLHFKDSGMEFHNDGYVNWKITNKDIKLIRNFLQKNHKKDSQYNIWQMACYLWNLEYGFFDEDDQEDYFKGEFDEKLKDHPSYVPSTQKMPDTWEYNPKGNITESTEVNDILDEFVDEAETNFNTEAYSESVKSDGEKAASHLSRMIEHLLKLAYCTNDRNHSVWISDAEKHRKIVFDALRWGTRRKYGNLENYLESNLQDIYDSGRKFYDEAAEKYPDLKERRDEISEKCKWELGNLMEWSIKDLVAELFKSDNTV